MQKMLRYALLAITLSLACVFSTFAPAQGDHGDRSGGDRTSQQGDHGNRDHGGGYQGHRRHHHRHHHNHNGPSIHIHL